MESDTPTNRASAATSRGDFGFQATDALGRGLRRGMGTMRPEAAVIPERSCAPAHLNVKGVASPVGMVTSSR